MRRTVSDVVQVAGYAVVLLSVAVVLALNPKALWSRWLAYPAAAASLLAAGGLTLSALERRNERIVAGAGGIEWRRKPDPRGVRWKEVGAVKDVMVIRRQTSRKEREVTVHRYLLFLDRSGVELLTLPVLDPPDSFKLLLDSIPAWTGLEIRAESVLR
jgi:hypothetical protein